MERRKGHRDNWRHQHNARVREGEEEERTHIKLLQLKQYIYNSRSTTPLIQTDEDFLISCRVHGSWRFHANRKPQFDLFAGRPPSDHHAKECFLNYIRGLSLICKCSRVFTFSDLGKGTIRRSRMAAGRSNDQIKATGGKTIADH